MSKLNLAFDQNDIDAIAADFDLRQPNKEALRQLIFALTSDDFDASITQVMNLATGVGKTYLMAAFIEYLRRHEVGNVLIVTPSLTVQQKTVQNFTPGSSRYIAGATVAPDITTPQDYSAWQSMQSGPSSLLHGNAQSVMAFIFNIHQLIAPKSLDGATQGSTAKAGQLRTRKFDESAGALFEYLQSRNDLVVIADESHLYGPSAKAFSAALKELEPAAIIGLTASASEGDHIVYRYPLFQAIRDRYVKAPVLAFRKGGYRDGNDSEEQQLRDALALRSIKQSAYEAFATANDRPHLNAVLFVVCADVAHATQVANLLRSPGFLNDDKAVLQVDNEHDDEQTRHALEHLDRSDARTLAVVSVNKLKEGWDVKNIAVIATLRAMASEVLTQQTMGRGLRLPFGEYTDILQIDQLDIISHRSFDELLTAENVLAHFGIEESTPEAQEAARAAIQRASRSHTGEQTEFANGRTAVTDYSADALSDEEQVTISSSDGSTHLHPGTADEKPTLSVNVLDDADLNNELDDFVPLWVPRNPRYKDTTFAFPVTTMKRDNREFSLGAVSQPEIERAAKRVTTSGDVVIRKEILASLDAISVADTEIAEIASMPIESERAEAALLKLIMGFQFVPATGENKTLAKNHVLRKFLAEAPVDHWTTKALASAEQELSTLIHTTFRDLLSSAKDTFQIHPRQLPKRGGYHLPPGARVHEPISSQRKFVKRRHYRGWFKSLFEVETFDSWSAEYELATLLNTSPNIEWWMRLHPSDGAFIQYNLRSKYYPDFVARDEKGHYWIIEGKDEKGRDDDLVQAKREAAEQIVVELMTVEDYAGQTWGYMIAFEDDVKLADSWNHLKDLSRPVTT